MKGLFSFAILFLATMNGFAQNNFETLDMLDFARLMSSVQEPAVSMESEKNLVNLDSNHSEIRFVLDYIVQDKKFVETGYKEVKATKFGGMYVFGTVDNTVIVQFYEKEIQPGDLIHFNINGVSYFLEMVLEK